MKIISKVSITTTSDTSQFRCPTCKSIQNYRHQTVKKYLTFFSIPFFPKEIIGEYVECNKCSNTYDKSILEMPTEGSMDMDAEYNKAVKKAMIHVLLADGIIDEAEIKTCQNIYRKVTGRNIDKKSLNDEIEQIKETGETLLSLSKLEGCLNSQGKEFVIRASYLVAFSDGEFHEDEENLIIRIGELLGMTDSHINGVLSDLTA